MHAKFRVFIAALVVAVVGSFSTDVSADAKLRARLDKGEIIVKTKEIKDSDIPEATLMAVIEAPPADVWAIINDCSKYKKNMIRVLEAELLKKKGETYLCKVTTDMPWPLANLTAITTAKHVVGPPVWSRTWALVKGDFESNRGSWRIQAFDPSGTRSLVIYKVHAVPDMLVPDGLIKKAQKETLPKLIKHLRKKVAK